MEANITTLFIYFAFEDFNRSTIIDRWVLNILELTTYFLGFNLIDSQKKRLKEKKMFKSH